MFDETLMPTMADLKRVLITARSRNSALVVLRNGTKEEALLFQQRAHCFEEIERVVETVHEFLPGSITEELMAKLGSSEDSVYRLVSDRSCARIIKACALCDDSDLQMEELAHLTALYIELSFQFSASTCELVCEHAERQTFMLQDHMNKMDVLKDTLVSRQSDEFVRDVAAIFRDQLKQLSAETYFTESTALAWAMELQEVEALLEKLHPTLTTAESEELAQHLLAQMTASIVVAREESQRRTVHQSLAQKAVDNAREEQHRAFEQLEASQLTEERKQYAIQLHHNSLLNEKQHLDALTSQDEMPFTRLLRIESLRTKILSVDNGEGMFIAPVPVEVTSSMVA